MGAENSRMRKPASRAEKASVFDGAPPTLEAFAARLGAAKNVVVLCGAGISTSCGIPDFRTPGTGLYSQLERYGLSRPEDVFSLPYFAKRPQPFFHLAREIWPGRFCPSVAHAFLRLLHEKGALRRVFSQNIDTLEAIAGLPQDVIVEAHGSFTSNTCQSCRARYDMEWMKAKLFGGGYTPTSASGDFDEDSVVVPMCDACGKGVVKPDIVFFGERLPERFFRLLKEDVKVCDALVVMGTSLAVYPVNTLPGLVKLTTPRLLINREAVGLVDPRDVAAEEESAEEGGEEKKSDDDEAKADDEDSDDEEFDPGASAGFRFKLPHPSNYRDVFLQGDCDAGVRSLAAAVGWGADLEAVHATIKAAHEAETAADAATAAACKPKAAAAVPAPAATAEEDELPPAVTIAAAQAAAAGADAASRAATDAAVDAAGLGVLSRALADLELGDEAASAGGGAGGLAGEKNE